MIVAPLTLALAFSANGLQPDAAAVVSIRVETSTSAKSCAALFDSAWGQVEPSDAVQGAQSVTIRFSEREGVFESKLSFADGTQRRLSEASDTCSSLARATAFTLRMALNQPKPEVREPLNSEATQAQPTPSEGAPALVSPAVPHDSPFEIQNHEVALASGVSTGLVGAPTWTMQLSYATRLMGPVKPALTLGWHLPQTVAAQSDPNDRYSRMLIHLSASGCYEPLRAPFILGVCGELMVGAMINQPKNTAERVTTSPLWVAAAAGIEAALPIGNAFLVLVKGQLILPLNGMGLVALAISNTVSVQNIGGIVSLGIAWDPS